MRKCVAVAAIWVTLGGVPAARGGPKVGEDVALQKKVDAIFAEYDKPDSPGCSLAVIREGKLIYTRGYGRANLEHNLPITSRTVFDIGSTSKQFTAASILLLEQQGKLSRDDDVRKWVPELPDYGKTITIHHLLHHTSGLRDYLTLMSLAGIDFHNVTGTEEALAILVRQKELNFSPGEEHLYSNSGYFLLSVIVERASGKSLRAYAQEQIFGPLGMEDTHYHDDHAEVVVNRASAYEPKEGGGYAIDMSNFEQTGDGAVFTTVEDLLKWDQNFYETKVGGRVLVDGLLTKGRLNSGRELEYATGLFVSKHRGLPMVSHGGGWGGYRAELLRFPEQKFSVVCQCNLGSTNPSGLTLQVAEVYLADKMTPEPARPVAAPTEGGDGKSASALTPEQGLEISGIYRNPANGGLRRIAVVDGRLRVDSFGGLTAELLPAGKDEFTVAGARFQIRLRMERNEGRIVAMVVSRRTDPPETERFERAETFAPTAAELTAYAGTYYSEDLDATYVLSEKEGKLWMRVGYDELRELRPAIRDLFVGPFGVQLEFARDALGRAGNFVVQAGRVRNIRFVRR